MRASSSCKRKENSMHAFFKQNSISGDRGLQHGFTKKLLLEPSAQDASLFLKQHQHLRMHDACGWTVRSVAGTIWITQDGDIRDIVLEAGESFTLDRDRTALLSPLNEAHITLESGRCKQSAPHRRRAHPALRCAGVRAVPA
jgi:hypothetical protein